MNEITISRCRLEGEVKAPSSKSVGHRAIIAASLAKGESIITNLDISDDIQATMECMQKLGTRICSNGEYVKIDGSQTLKIRNDLELDCNESGSTLRFLIPISLLTNKKVEFSGKGRLMERPQKPYMDLFLEKGIKYSQNEGRIAIEGNLSGGKFEIPGNISSQFITGLLYALPNLKEKSEIIITKNLESKGYIDLTLDSLRTFGINIENQNYEKFIIEGNQEFKPCKYEVEADFSRSSLFSSSILLRSQGELFRS